jgi:anti-sigma B factor antagonist
MDDTGGHGSNGEAPEPDSLQVTRRDGPNGEVLLHIAGEVDLASGQVFRAGLSAAIEDSAGAVVLDLGQVTFIDSSGIEQLVRAREEARGRLRVCALHPSVRRVLEMTALLDWFPCRPDGADDAADGPISSPST